MTPEKKKKAAALLREMTTWEVECIACVRPPDTAGLWRLALAELARRKSVRDAES